MLSKINGSPWNPGIPGARSNPTHRPAAATEETPKQIDSLQLTSEAPAPEGSGILRRFAKWAKAIALATALTAAVSAHALAGATWMSPNTNPERVVEMVEKSRSPQMALRLNGIANNVVQKMAIDSRDGATTERHIGGGLPYAEAAGAIKSYGRVALLRYKGGQITKDEALAAITHQREVAWGLGIAQTEASPGGTTVTPAESETIQDFLFANQPQVGIQK